jgi:hypothetical protein
MAPTATPLHDARGGPPWRARALRAGTRDLRLSWDPVAEPTATDIAEFRRLCAETGLWGDDNPQTAEGGQFSDEELASRLR